MSTPNEVFEFLARVAPAGSARAVVWDVRDNGPVATPLVAPHGGLGGDQRISGVPVAPAAPLVDAKALARWRRAAALRKDDDVARFGLLSLVGHGLVAGERRRVVAPLLAQSTAPSMLDTIGLSPEPSITTMGNRLGLDEEDLRSASGAQPMAGAVEHRLLLRLHRIKRVVDALEVNGTRVDHVVVGGGGNVLDSNKLWLVLGELRFIDERLAAAPSVGRLEAWSYRSLEATALAALYEQPALESDADDEQAGHDELIAAVDEPRSSLPLTASQQRAVLAARHRPISVVSGAPGTGKSHTAVAIALDAVARGASVLVATRSAHAAEVLTEMLREAAGPPPVRFGGDRTRRMLADELAAGLPAAASRAQRADAQDAVDAAAAELRAVDTTLAALLSVASSNGRAARDTALRIAAPGAFGGKHGPAALRRLVDRAQRTTGPFAALRARRALGALRRACAADADAGLHTLAAAVERARISAVAAMLEDAGGLDIASVRHEHAQARRSLREAVATQLRVETAGVRSGAGRRTVAALAAALRTGSQRRADALAKIDAAELTDALPLWVGTVAEVEQLLPATPGMFDLVIVDEASQLDQLAAAPVLARARRAVVVGDPRQLRHVSFVADLDVDAALARVELEHLAGRLDIRRVSTFDAAAGVAPVLWLDEHLRSIPHLIGFSARRFYDGRLRVSTNHPSVDTHDAIDTVHVNGSAGELQVVAAEVAAVLDLLDELAQRVATGDPSVGTVGVITPFRKQADAIEAAVLDRYDLEVIEALSLRVGTVHGFQGGERDTMIASLGLVEDGAPQRRRFAEAPDLLNVLVTRARRRMVVVTALPVGTGGLIGAYLDHAERPPSPPSPTASDDRWTAMLARELERLGMEVSAGYGVGRFTVDLVVTRRDGAVALLTAVLPDVPDDIARHDALVRSGWDIVEAYPTPAEHDPVHRALELQHELR